MYVVTKVLGVKIKQTLKALICPFIAGISPNVSSPARSIPTTPSFENSWHKERISNDHSKKKKINLSVKLGNEMRKM